MKSRYLKNIIMFCLVIISLTSVYSLEFSSSNYSIEKTSTGSISTDLISSNNTAIIDSTTNTYANLDSPNFTMISGFLEDEVIIPPSDGKKKVVVQSMMGGLGPINKTNITDNQTNITTQVTTIKEEVKKNDTIIQTPANQVTGEIIKEEVKPVIETPKTEQKSSNLIVLTMLGLILALVIGIGGYVVLYSKKEKEIDNITQELKIEDIVVEDITIKFIDDETNELINELLNFSKETKKEQKEHIEKENGLFVKISSRIDKIRSENINELNKEVHKMKEYEKALLLVAQIYLKVRRKLEHFRPRSKDLIYAKEIIMEIPKDIEMMSKIYDERIVLDKMVAVKHGLKLLDNNGFKED